MTGPENFSKGNNDMNKDFVGPVETAVQMAARLAKKHGVVIDKEKKAEVTILETTPEPKMVLDFSDSKSKPLPPPPSFVVEKEAAAGPDSPELIRGSDGQWVQKRFAE